MCVCFKILQPSSVVASTPNRTKTNHHWLNHHHPTIGKLREKLSTSDVTEENLGLTTLPHFVT